MPNDQRGPFTIPSGKMLLRALAYVWPASRIAGFLKDDGSGNLSMVNHEVAANIHGLPASVNVLGNRNASGEFIQRGTVSGSSAATSTTAVSFFRELATTFPVAFGSTPIVLVCPASGFSVGTTVISTTGVTARQWDNQGTGSIPWTYAYIAIGT